MWLWFECRREECGCLSSTAPWVFLQIRERERERGRKRGGGESKAKSCPRRRIIVQEVLVLFLILARLGSRNSNERIGFHPANSNP